MTKYLISFPSRAMAVADDEWELVSRESHAVIRQAKDAGAWVFGRLLPVPARGPGVHVRPRVLSRPAGQRRSPTRQWPRPRG